MSAAPLSNRWRWMASATTTSVPGRSARWRSAWRATGVARGSTTTMVAPRVRASFRYGIRWMPDAEGLTPHEQDQAGLGIVLVDDRRHLAVERLVGRAGRRGAHRAGEARGAEPPEEDRVGVVLGQVAVRSAVAQRQDGLAARLGADRREPLGDPVEGVVPAHPLEPALALGAAAHGREVQPVVAVDAAIEAPDLGADVAAGHRIGVAAVDGRDAAALHRDRAASRRRDNPADTRSRQWTPGARSRGGWPCAILRRASNRRSRARRRSSMYPVRADAAGGPRGGACRRRSGGRHTDDRHAARRDCRRRLRRARRRAGARRGRGRRDPRRSPQPPRLPAAALPGGDGGPVARRHRRADPLGAAPAAQRPGAARRGGAGRRRRPAGRAGERRGPAVSRPGARHRRHARLLRARRLGRPCPGPEDARRRRGDPPAGADRVREGRGRGRPGSPARAAHLRRDRRRARPASRWPAPSPRSPARRSATSSIASRRRPRASSCWRAGRRSWPATSSRCATRRVRPWPGSASRSASARSSPTSTITRWRWARSGSRPAPWCGRPACRPRPWGARSVRRSTGSGGSRCARTCRSRSIRKCSSPAT